MGSARTKRPSKKVIRRIEELKAERRKDVLKGMVGLVVVVAIALSDQLLKLNGIVSAYDIPFENLMILVAMGLAIFVGSASMDFVKKGKIVKELCETHDISENDIP